MWLLQHAKNRRFLLRPRIGASYYCCCGGAEPRTTAAAAETAAADYVATDKHSLTSINQLSAASSNLIQSSPSFRIPELNQQCGALGQSKRVDPDEITGLVMVSSKYVPNFCQKADDTV